jgi:hypothetical protein
MVFARDTVRERSQCKIFAPIFSAFIRSERRATPTPYGTVTICAGTGIQFYRNVGYIYCMYLGQKFDGRRSERVFATAGNGEFKDPSSIRSLIGSTNPRLPSQQMILARHANVVVGRLFQILEFLAEAFGGL